LNVLTGSLQANCNASKPSGFKETNKGAVVLSAEFRRKWYFGIFWAAGILLLYSSLVEWSQFMRNADQLSSVLSTASNQFSLHGQAQIASLILLLLRVFLALERRPHSSVSVAPPKKVD
jgi:hypothetical protein